MIHKKAALETAKMVSFSVITPLALWVIFTYIPVAVIVSILGAGLVAYLIHGFYQFQVSLHNLTEKQ